MRLAIRSPDVRLYLLPTHSGRVLILWIGARAFTFRLPA